MFFVIAAYTQNYLTPLGDPGSEEARMRTMNEVMAARPISSLPVTITNSGSYVVVCNLTGVSGSNGISILVNNVTLDLNGFCLNGVTGSLYGICIPSNQTSIVIKNGVMRDWGLYGLYAADTANSTFSGLTSISNGWGANCSGIYIGKNNLLSDCVSTGSKSYGIWTGSGCSIRDCKVSENQGRGINATDGCTLTGCSAYGNGADGIASYNGSTIVRCMAYRNLDDGIYGQNCTIRDCAAFGNTNNGVNATMCTVAGVSASENYGHGIRASSSLITQCSAIKNNGHGILAYNSLVNGNSCQQNGYVDLNSAGISVAGAGCRIENNLVLYNDYGIETSVGGNFIVRNTASNNTTNYVISGTQTIGFTCTAPGTITLQDPWMNFEF